MEAGRSFKYLERFTCVFGDTVLETEIVMSWLP